MSDEFCAIFLKNMGGFDEGVFLAALRSRIEKYPDSKFIAGFIKLNVITPDDLLKPLVDFRFPDHNLLDISWILGSIVTAIGSKKFSIDKGSKIYFAVLYLYCYSVIELNADIVPLATAIILENAEDEDISISLQLCRFLNWLSVITVQRADRDYDPDSFFLMSVLILINRISFSVIDEIGEIYKRQIIVDPWLENFLSLSISEVGATKWKKIIDNSMGSSSNLIKASEKIKELFTK